MTQSGAGQYTYELIRDFFKLPAGQTFGLVSRVGADAQDRIYVFQRKDPPVVVFDREGKYLGAWGSGGVTDPHGLKIIGDIVYTTDRSDSVAKSFTLDGKVLLELGTRGQHSDTGNVSNWLAERAAGPFNHPTEMIAHPNGDLYVTDGYRNARVHRFARDGRLVSSNRGARRAMARASSTCRTASRLTTTASSTSPTGRTSESRSSRLTVNTSASGPAWAAPTTSPAARTAISTSPSRKTTASPPRFASATDKEMCSPAWRAATSTASASTRRATSTPA
jgi:hypothetical protein